MKTLKDNLQEIANQTVIVRCNFDVPLENGQVVDTTRIEDAVDTIKALTDQSNRLILIAHQDRPDGQFKKEACLKPIVPVLENLLNQPVAFADYQPDFHQVAIAPNQPITLVDNLRFWAQEEENHPDFTAWLTSLADTYINEAFANCHRDHASITGIAQKLPAFAGLHLTKEIELLEKVRSNPEKPLVVVLGGAKLETKEPLVEAFADSADHILVGGKIAVDLKAKHQTPPGNVTIAELTEDQKDITQEAAHNFAQIIQQAQTVIWNGTMGVFEEPEHLEGTKIVAQAVNQTEAFTLVGGGDTETALTQLKLESGIDHISSGGGAMLTYLQTGTLIGIEELQ